jgi:enamine deaminase RidA (YjgF/YER057c/UK114 family)
MENRMPDIAYKTVLPEGWPRPRGFSHATIAKGSGVIRVSGQIAAEKGSPVRAGSSFGEQWKIALENVVAVVRAAGADASSIVLLRAFVTDMEEFRASGAAVGEGWRATLGSHFPAMTLVEISKLVDPNAKVEIECEAVLP